MLPVVRIYLPKLSPVEGYLKLQGRFRHLFESAVQMEAISHIQSRVDAYWQDAKKWELYSDRANRWISAREISSGLFIDNPG